MEYFYLLIKFQYRFNWDFVTKAEAWTALGLQQIIILINN